MGALYQVKNDGLGWVKKELDSILEKARVGLETFVEDNSDKGSLANASQCLFQANGALQMVELYGASLLAEEIISVMQAVIDDAVVKQEEALEVLSRAMLSLPDYLEHIQAGNRDIPTVLMPILNDLRTARNASLLSGEVLFYLKVDSVAVPSENADSNDHGQDLRQLARKLRNSFQIGLLHAIRGDNTTHGFAQMGAVLARLRAASQLTAGKRLWWIAEALTEALSRQALEVSVTVKSLFGQVDRQLRCLITEGEAHFAEFIPEPLIKNLLYYLAISEDVGTLVGQVKLAYSLDEIMPAESQLIEVRAQLAGPNFTVLKTVSEAVQEDLAEVKDQLELYINTDKRDVRQLDGLVGKLESIAATLSMLGLDESHGLVLEQASIVEDICNNEVVVTESAILDMARVMLDIEAAIEEIVASRAAEMVGVSSVQEFDRDSGTAMSDVQYSKISNAVVVEAQRDMAVIKETLVEYVANSANTALLEGIPESLERIKGALSIIRVESLTPVLNSLAQYISQRLASHNNPPHKDELEALADAVTSVEYFLESLQYPSGDRDRILELGKESVASLGFPLTEEDISRSDPERIEREQFAAVEHELIASDEDAGLSLADNILLDYIAEDSNETIIAEAGLNFEIQPQTPIASSSLTDESVLFSEDAEKKNSLNYAVIDPEVDEEILEVFTEETEEQCGIIRDQIVVWRSNPADEESLTTLRRGFHTLKGSGRLIGAELMGEFAWSFEEMLNRVIEKRIGIHEGIFQALESAVAALPQLLEQIRGGPGANSPDIDINGIIDWAQSLSNGEKHAGPIAESSQDDSEVDKVEISEVESPDTTEAEEPFNEAADLIELADTDIPQSIDIDSELVQIFLSEAEQHISFLEEILQQDAPVRPNKQFVRSLHTLKGASMSAQVRCIPELCGPLEIYAERLLDAGVALSADAQAVYVQTTEVLRDVLGSLSAGVLADIDINKLVGEIDVLLAGADALIDEAVAMAHVATDEAEASTVKVSTQDVPANPLQTTTLDSVPVTSDASQDMIQGIPDMPDDQESDLVEIFLEEAEDILLACDNALVQWRDTEAEAEAVSEMKRQLHTIKGGARMSGFTNIGDLSHAMETAIIRFSDSEDQQANEDLLKSLQQSVDRLHHMLEQVKHSDPVYPAADLIAGLEYLQKSAARPLVPPPEFLSELPADEDPEISAGLTDRPMFDSSEPEEAEQLAEQYESSESLAQDRPSTDTPSDVAARIGAVEIPALDQERIQAAFDSARHAVQKKPATPPAPAARPAVAQEMIRVSADLLDSLVNNAGEVNIYQSRFTQQTHSYGYNLLELEQTVMRLREQLRNLEIETEAQILFRHEREADSRHGDFDPLELDRYSNLQQLSRSLGESVNDLVSIKDILVNLVRDTETLLSQQSRVSTELQEGLMRTRMVQFSGVVPRLRRIVRQNSDELGKQVELQVLGEQNEIDRSVLNRMVAPLEHLLRNAISHGIETPERREKAGKSSTGKIRISINREGAEVVMRVSDDGAGIDRDAVLDKARKQKLVSRRQKLTDQDILCLILEPGFSTATEVTQIAGRGVGMDVVDSEIKQLGGALNIESESGEGTRFTIRLPFTLAITQALLVQSGEEVYCLPLASIEGVVRIGVEELNEKYQQTSPVYHYANQGYQLMHLGDLLGHSKPALEGPGGMYPVLLVRSGENRIALQVEALLGNREIVLKPVGRQLSKVRGISGATILGDGRVVLVLDMTGLVRLGAGIHIFGGGQTEVSAPPEQRPATIMVVDDSITIRKITSRLLERNHYAVLTAKDGVDAVAVLQEQLPDLILLDIEMPRMDGFELAMHIRNSERLHHIPIIMITSRSGDKHRNRALEIGVNDYLGKPYKELELLQHIQHTLSVEPGIQPK